MSVATTGVALLPGYAAIGVAAPTLLVTMRAVRELPPVESASSIRRGRIGAWHTGTMALGIGAGMMPASLMSVVFTPAQLTAGWWRLACVALGLGLVGFCHAAQSRGNSGVPPRWDTGVQGSGANGLQRASDQRPPSAASASWRPELWRLHVLRLPSPVSLFPAALVAGIAIAGLPSMAMLGKLVAAPLRSTGVALSDGLATAVFGGTAPLVDQALMTWSDSRSRLGCTLRPSRSRRSLP